MVAVHHGFVYVKYLAGAQFSATAAAQQGE